ncbi:MAG TPA: hypothetical protein VJJ52_02405 [Candidatus Nanoarchaeia archaeon]|nr:hypothetical protein [Candidatus Nanoarchaeia archaeon]
MIQDVYIIGATGNVGKTLVRQICEKGDTNPDLHPNPTRIVGLASSTHTIYSAFGLSKEDSYDFISRKSKSAKKYNSLFDLLNRARVRLRDEESNLVFIDVTALSEPMREFHLHVIEHTPYGIVTANKNPIALYDYKTFKKLTHDTKRYGYRCSVMAGADAVPLIQDNRDLNDRPRIIEGCFSGTLGYITTGLEKGIAFSEIVREAFRRNYTEPHPRDDLSGLDVARKLIVLARTAGFPVSLNDIQREPFIPEAYLTEMDVESFMSKITKLDGWFSDKMQQARARDNTLRYVAKMDVQGQDIAMRVALTEVPNNSTLGNLKGTLNALILLTDAGPDEQEPPLIKPGAGLGITARNIRRDLLHLLPERRNMI